MLTTETFQGFIGGQVQVITRNSPDKHATHRAEIKDIAVTNDGVLILSYNWSAFGQGQGNNVHWVFEDRDSDQFNLADFDPNPAVNGHVLMIKNKKQSIIFFPSGYDDLLPKEKIHNPAS